MILKNKTIYSFVFDGNFHCIFYFVKIYIETDVIKDIYFFIMVMFSF